MFYSEPCNNLCIYLSKINKFAGVEIRWNYGIFRSVRSLLNKLTFHTFPQIYGKNNNQ